MRALLVALGFLLSLSAAPASVAVGGSRALLSLSAAPVLADARADFERAKRAVRAGEHDQAVGYYTNIIRSRELGGEALAVVYQNRGHTFLMLKHFDGAIGDFTTALRIKPDYAEAHYGRGVGLVAKRRSEAALRDFDAAIALKPEFAPSHGERGRLKLQLGRHTEALADLEEAIRLGSADWRFYNDRGIIMLAWGDLENAFLSFDAAIGISFDAAIGIDPKSNVAYRNRGLIYFLAKKMPEASFDFTQALDLAPGDMETLLWQTIYNTYVALDVGPDIAKRVNAEQMLNWPGPLLELFLDKDVPAAVLRIGETQFAGGPAKLLAQTRYSVGVYYLSRGELEAAQFLFEKVVSMRATTLMEYHAAWMALEWMGVTEPVPAESSTVAPADEKKE